MMTQGTYKQVFFIRISEVLKKEFWNFPQLSRCYIVTMILYSQNFGYIVILQTQNYNWMNSIFLDVTNQYLQVIRKKVVELLF